MAAQARPGGTQARLLVTLAAAIGTIALVGCSSGTSTATSTSSKPAYCADLTSLQKSISGLTSLNASSGVSGLKSQLSKIESDTATLASSAKSHFPSQTSALTSSVDALKSSVAALPSSPSASQIATVSKDAFSVVSSVKSFTTAAHSKCG